MDKAEAKRWTMAGALLEQVLDLPPDQRPAAIAELGARHGVGSELTALYDSTEKGSVLDESLDRVLADMPGPAAPRNALRGQVLGPWKLGEEFGRGGMSVVYHAQRTGQDFQQHAAVKILSVAHFGERFVESFVRERQILSDLHHPGIARLIDGGITPDGAPYLVMQRVEGERIDKWCAEHGVDTETLARLMLKLCHAVAYAHRHLVVHQDIKPANVLVDEHQQPVLIDFGIAKLLSQSGEARVLQAFTPQFAAPEQRAGEAITTATDVYSLGMLFRSLLGERRREPDLEAILALATHRDADQRYANARHLADDLQAWLEQRPVRARTPTFRYRTSRFVRRNRWAVAAAAIIVLSLVSGLGAAIWQARIAASERDIARSESARATQAIEFLQELFRASDPDRSRGEVVTARELLDQGAHQVRNTMQDTPGLQAEMLVLLGDLYRELGESGPAGPLLEEGLRLADQAGDIDLRVNARRALALQRMETGEHESALSLAEAAEQQLEVLQRIPGTMHATLAQPILFSLAELGRVSEAAERGRAMMNRARDHQRLPKAALYDYLFSVGNVLLIAEQPQAAAELLLEAADIASLATHSPSAQISLQSNLAGVLDRAGNMEGALMYRRQVIALVEEIYPPDHPERARMLSNLGATLSSLGQYAESADALREALDIYENIYADNPHPRVAAAQNNLGQALEQAGDFMAAEPHLNRAWELAGELFGKNDPRYVVATGNLGNLYRELGDFDRAEQLILESLQLRRSLLGPEHRAVGTALGVLAALRLDQKRWQEALQLSSEGLDLYDRIGFDSPRHRLALETRRARALAGLDRPREAETVFANALALAKAAGANAKTALPPLLEAHARFLANQGDPRAEAAIAEALEVNSEMLGADHPATVSLRALAARH